MDLVLKKAIRVFDEIEVKHQLLKDIGTTSLLQKHQEAMNILCAIVEFKDRKKNIIESIERLAGTFPRLRAKCVNEIDTINMCINRLSLKYNKKMKELNDLNN